MDKKTIVIALGGNALGGNYAEQIEAVKNTAKAIVDLIEEGHKLVITHGNGPQVGMIQKAMDELSQTSPNYGRIPLPISVAMSQGYIGTDLQNAIRYEMSCRGVNKTISTILTEVEVDPNDEAFSNPTKPIGRFLSKEEADALAKQGISVMEDAGRGYREVVASPMPIDICELDTIKTLLDNDQIVITCGGGGIPVIKKDGKTVCVDAVIDKDNASALLAEKIDADFLVILTAVEKVAINFRQPDEEWLSDLTVDKALEYVNEGHFAKGSMLPKVEASIRFAKSKEGRSALITLLEKAGEAIKGNTGTVIHL